MVLFAPVSANGIPTAAFFANNTSGPAPLPVQFTNLSSLNTMGWAWFFGDEQFKEPWIQVNASSEWSKRIKHSSVVLPDGSIVLTGGYEPGIIWNDTWRSTDKGATWTMMNASSAWRARYGHSSVATPGGSIIVMGGCYVLGAYLNDVWRSDDNGVTWVLVNTSPGWSARYAHASVLLPDNSILLMGGQDSITGRKNDTWRSMDNGATWSLVNESPAWSARHTFTSVIPPDGSIVLMGGYDNIVGRKNDTWRSTDNGITWSRMNASPGWSARWQHSSVALPDGSIVLMGGEDRDSVYRNDVWRSMDNGATWTRINASAGWVGRGDHTSVALPDGSIVLMGGGLKNDVWRFQPVESSEENPVHTYAAPGIYNVTLQASNGAGINSTQKAGYITVAVPLPGSMAGVFRPSTHTFLLKNTTGTTEFTFGQSTDIPISGDWNGDGFDEVGVHRAALQKFLLKNGTENTVVKWGQATDTGAAGDWNGDGMGDIGVFRPSVQKFVLKNGTEKTIIKWGLSTDKPVTGDWNGDGLWDVGVFRPSTRQFLLKNGTEKTTISWGQSGDIAVAGDWNNDGLWDVGVFRPSVQKFILKNGTEMTKITFGESTDLPVTGKWT